MSNRGVEQTTQAVIAAQIDLEEPLGTVHGVANDDDVRVATERLEVRWEGLLDRLSQ